MSAALPEAGLVLAAVLYWHGGRKLLGGRHRRERNARALSFYAGLATLAIAVGPPLDGRADRFFWAHMVQHSLLQLVAPPLIVVGAPWLPFWRLIPLGLRRPASRWFVCSGEAHPLRRLARGLARPAVAWVLFLAAIWLSHLPRVFDFALSHGVFHGSEHLLFLALGVLFWSRAIDSPPFHARLAPLGAVVFFFAAMLAESALALIILAARSPLYSGYALLPRGPGAMTALADQQFGAGMMFEPASIPLLLAIGWAVKAHFRQADPNETSLPGVAQDT